ncbi:cbf mak21 family protein, partial [Cystoisospora suis]
YSTTDRLTRVVYEHLQSPDFFTASNRAALFSLLHSLILPSPSLSSSASRDTHDLHPSTSETHLRSNINSELSLSSSPPPLLSPYQSLTDITRSTALCKRLLQSSLSQIEQPGVAAAAVQVCAKFLLGSVEHERREVAMKKKEERQRKEKEGMIKRGGAGAGGGAGGGGEEGKYHNVVGRLVNETERNLQDHDEEENFHDIDDDEDEETEKKVKKEKSSASQLNGEGEDNSSSFSSSSSWCVYDPVKRDPRYSRASESRFWELFAATTFYHPAVSTVASSTIDAVGESMLMTCDSTQAPKKKKTNKRGEEEDRKSNDTRASLLSQRLYDDEIAAGLASSLTHSRVLDLLAYKPSAIFDSQREEGRKSQRAKNKKK